MQVSPRHPRPPIMRCETAKRLSVEQLRESLRLRPQILRRCQHPTWSTRETRDSTWLPTLNGPPMSQVYRVDTCQGDIPIAPAILFEEGGVARPAKGRGHGALCGTTVESPGVRRVQRLRMGRGGALGPRSANDSREGSSRFLDRRGLLRALYLGACRADGR